MPCFDFVELERKLQSAYDNYIANTESKKCKEVLFLAIQELTRAIVEVEGRKAQRDDPFRDVDKEYLVYEYSLYLFQRIVEGRFVLPDLKGRDKFAWTAYIRINLQHILWTLYREQPREVPFKDIAILLGDLIAEREQVTVSSLLDEFSVLDVEAGKFYYTIEENDDGVELRVYREDLLVKLANILKTFYSEAEIRKYLSLLISLPKSKWREDKELYKFVGILTALYKRYFEEYSIKKLQEVDIDSVLRSTLFLATILSSDIDNRLFVGLDLQNLYRLAVLCGGESIIVPTVEEIEDLVAAAYVVWRMLREGESVEDARVKCRNKLSLRANPVRVDKYIKSLSKFLSVNFRETGSEQNLTVIGMLLAVITSLHKTTQQVLEEIEKATESERDIRKLVEVYKELSSMLQTVQDSVINMRKLIHDKTKK